MVSELVGSAKVMLSNVGVRIEALELQLGTEVGQPRVVGAIAGLDHAVGDRQVIEDGLEPAVGQKLRVAGDGSRVGTGRGIGDRLECPAVQHQDIEAARAAVEQAERLPTTSSTNSSSLSAAPTRFSTPKKSTPATSPATSERRRAMEFPKAEISSSDSVAWRSSATSVVNLLVGELRPVAQWRVVGGRAAHGSELRRRDRGLRRRDAGQDRHGGESCERSIDHHIPHPPLSCRLAPLT